MADARLDDLVAAVQAADETFDKDDAGNAKFREFIRKLMRPRGTVTMTGVSDQRPVGGTGYRYGVPL